MEHVRKRIPFCFMEARRNNKHAKRGFQGRHPMGGLKLVVRTQKRNLHAAFIFEGEMMGGVKLQQLIFSLFVRKLFVCPWTGSTEQKWAPN